MIKSARAAIFAIPTEVIKFLAKAIILLVIWKVAYLVYLKPQHTVDAFFTDFTIKSTVEVLRAIFGYQAITVDTVDPTLIKMNGKTVVFIMDPCNALELYVLYTGFILCIPASLKRMVVFIIAGLMGIYILNIIRCSALAYLNYINFSMVNVAHHYVFTLIVYSAIFFTWVRYIQASKLNELEKP